MGHKILDLFGNELNKGDSIISVTIYKNKPSIRKGYIESITETPREACLIINNVDTNRKLIKYVSPKTMWSSSEILKIDWINKNKREPTIFSIN